MKFNWALVFYTHNEILTEDEKLDNELKKYEKQLMLDENNIVYHQDSAENTWVLYLEHWRWSDLLNQIYKNHSHVADVIMLNIIWVRQWWLGMRKDIKHFVQHCSECQLITKSYKIHRDEMHLSHIWQDHSQSFKCWDLDLIGVLFITEWGNRWIVTAIDYSIRWSVVKTLKDETAEILVNFIIQQIY